jgi:hypothetical protein
MSAVSAELLAQLRDMDVHCAGLHVIGVLHVPSLSEQCAAADDTTGVFRQDPQDGNFAGREFELLIAMTRHTAVGSNLERPSAKMVILGTSLAFEQGLHTRQ